MIGAIFIKLGRAPATMVIFKLTDIANDFLPKDG
jgi:hypothetical protein